MKYFHTFVNSKFRAANHIFHLQHFQKIIIDFVIPTVSLKLFPLQLNICSKTNICLNNEYLIA